MFKPTIEDFKRAQETDAKYRTGEGYADSKKWDKIPKKDRDHYYKVQMYLAARCKGKIEAVSILISNPPERLVKYFCQ